MCKSKPSLALAFVLSMTAPANSVLACAFDSPTSMIDGEQTALLKAPIADFEHEIDRLCGPSDPRLHAIVAEHKYYFSTDDRSYQTDAADAADVLAATNGNYPLSPAVAQWRSALRKNPATAGDPPAAL